MRKEWIKPVLKNSDVKSTERTITTFLNLIINNLFLFYSYK